MLICSALRVARSARFWEAGSDFLYRSTSSGASWLIVSNSPLAAASFNLLPTSAWLSTALLDSSIIPGFSFKTLSAAISKLVCNFAIASSLKSPLSFNA